jgi:hypothetical protein
MLTVHEQPKQSEGVLRSDRTLCTYSNTSRTRHVRSTGSKAGRPEVGSCVYSACVPASRVMLSRPQICAKDHKPCDPELLLQL